MLTVIDLFSGCGGLSEGLMQVGLPQSRDAELLPSGLLPQESLLKLDIEDETPKYEILAHVEWELLMVRTLRANLVERWGHSADDALRRVVHFDIQKTTELMTGHAEDAELCTAYKNHDDVRARGLRGLVGEKAVDIIVGGPPCQAFSLALRSNENIQNDYRNYLFESFAKVVSELKPRLFVFENVEGLLSARPGGQAATQLIYDHFAEIGYQILPPKDFKRALFDLSNFGVPQRRKRVIIIGLKKAEHQDALADLQLLYEQLNAGRRYGETDESDSAQNNFDFEHQSLLSMSPKTFRDATSDLTKACHNHKDPHHRPRRQNERDRNIFRDWLKMKMDERSSEERLRFYNERLQKQSKHIKYRSLAWDRPAPTVVAHLYKDGLMFIHPDSTQARTITAREASLLQSFPPSYIFPEAMSVTFKMIGNAVPPLFARRLGEVLYNFLAER